MKLAIYIEGGGGSKEQKASLRQGFDKLLSELRKSAEDRGIGSKIVMCGSREDAFAKFKNACDCDSRALPILLVDSENTVRTDPVEHLTRQDGWNLRFASPDQIHLMVQVMETWLLADPKALLQYYGQGFQVGALPGAEDLETVAKSDIQQGLKRATINAKTKGEYHKIRHASDLLARIDVNVVRSRCNHCERLFTSVQKLFETVQP